MQFATHFTRRDSAAHSSAENTRSYTAVHVPSDNRDVRACGSWFLGYLSKCFSAAEIAYSLTRLTDQCRRSCNNNWEQIGRGMIPRYILIHKASEQKLGPGQLVFHARLKWNTFKERSETCSLN